MKFAVSEILFVSGLMEVFTTQSNMETKCSSCLGCNADKRKLRLGTLWVLVLFPEEKWEERREKCGMKLVSGKKLKLEVPHDGEANYCKYSCCTRVLYMNIFIRIVR